MTESQARAAVRGRRAHRRYCDELDAELDDSHEPRQVKPVSYPVIYHTSPGELYDEMSDRFYRG